MSTNILARLAFTSADKYIRIFGVTTNEPKFSDLADFIQKTRARKGLSQLDVEVASGEQITRGYVGQIETRIVQAESISIKKLEASQRV